MSLPLLHAGKSAPGLSAALDLRFALDKSLTAYRGPTPSFSRASTGSYFDESGVLRYANVNICLYSEDLTAANWTKTLVSISSNSSTAPDGKTTADKIVEDTSSSTHYIRQTFSGISSGAIVTFSAYFKAAGRNTVVLIGSDNVAKNYPVLFDLQNGVVLGNLTSWNAYAAPLSSSITSVGNGWYRCVVVAQLDAGVTTASITPALSNSSSTSFTGSYLGDGSSGVLQWGAQVETGSTVGTYCPTASSANSAPRFDHTYNGTSWVSRGLLVEEQRTNIWLQSNNLNTSPWVQTNNTTTESAAPSPDGTSNASSVVPNTTNASHYTYQVISTSATSYFVSFYAKANGYNFVQLSSGLTYDYVNFNLSTGAVGNKSQSENRITSQQIHSVGNGWYRCSALISATASSPDFGISVINADTASRRPAFAGDGTSGILLYGFQMEAGSFATSLIPATSASVTRSADVCQITGSDFSGFWNATEGTVAVEYDRIADLLTSWSGDAPTAVEFNDATNNNRIAIRSRRSGSNFEQGIINTANVLVADFQSSPAAGSGNPVRATIGLKLNDSAYSKNGESPISDTSCSLGSATQLLIGNGGTTGIFTLNGHIARLRYYRKRLPNETLQLLSEPDPTLNLQFALNKSLTPVAGPAPSFSRASTGTYFDASGVLTSASINTPRFDHVYSGGQWVSRGLLLEEQRTNLILQSSSLSTSPWSNTDYTVTSATSPDGTSNAQKLVAPASSASRRMEQSVTGTAANYTFSFYAKSAGWNFVQFCNGWSGSDYVNFDLSNGIISNSSGAVGSISSVGNGWYRCSATFSALASTQGVRIIPMATSIASRFPSTTGDGVNGIIVFGVQFELGAFPTSYIGTTSSSVTRSADVCQITGTSFNWMWNQGEGSFAVEAGTFSDSSYLGRYLEFTRTSSVGSPSIGVGTINSAGSAGGDNVYNYVWDSSTQAALYASPARPLAKSSFAWKVNDFAASINGATALTDTSGTVPTGIDVLTIGSRYGSLNIINGHIAKLLYYPARLTNTKLQQLST